MSGARAGAEAVGATMVDRLSNLIRTVDGSHTLGAGALAEALIGQGVWLPDKGETSGPRYPRGFVDQAAPSSHPERHIRVFSDPMADEPRICVFTMNNPKDVYRGASLSLTHAEQMAGLLLELVQKAREEVPHV